MYSNFITKGSITYRKIIHRGLTDIFDTQFTVIIRLMSILLIGPIAHLFTHVTDNFQLSNLLPLCSNFILIKNLFFSSNDLLQPNYFKSQRFSLQVNNCEVIINFFHISHILTFSNCRAIPPEFTQFVQPYELTKQFM